MTEVLENKVLERVKKLLALAGNNPNEQEATAATVKASRLIAEHNLTMAQINKKDDERVKNRIESFRAREQWVRAVWYAVADLNFTKYWYSKGKQGITHNLIGTEANVVSTQVMAEYLVDTVAQLAMDAPIPGGQRNAFKLGASARLSQRLAELKKQRQQGKEAPYQGTTLPALANLYQVHEHENEGYFKLLHPQMKLRLGSRAHTKNHMAWRLGHEAANDIGLDTQVNQHDQKALD